MFDENNQVQADVHMVNVIEVVQNMTTTDFL